MNVQNMNNFIGILYHGLSRIIFLLLTLRPEFRDAGVEPLLPNRAESDPDSVGV